MPDLNAGDSLNQVASKNNSNPSVLYYLKKILGNPYLIYFVFWLDILLIVFLTMNYQKFLQDLSRSILGLLAIIGSVAGLLTGKKTLNLKPGNAKNNFTSPLAWIPIVLVFAILVIVTKYVVFPTKYKINLTFNIIDNKLSWNKLDLKGRVLLFAKKTSGDSLITDAPLGNQHIELEYVPPAYDTKSLYLKFNAYNLTNNFSIKDSIWPISINKCIIPYSVDIEMKTHTYTFKLSGIYDRVVIDSVDVSFPDSMSFTRELIIGNYQCYLIKKSTGKRFHFILSLTEPVVDNIIKLPQNATDLTFNVDPASRFEIKESNGGHYLDDFVIDSKSKVGLRLLNSAEYNYTLSGKYYNTRQGIINFKEADQNGNLSYFFSGSERKISTVKIRAFLPDGDEVRAELSVNGKNRTGELGSYMKLPYGPYDFKLRFVDSTSNPGNAFIYENETTTEIIKDNLDFNDTLNLTDIRRK